MRVSIFTATHDPRYLLDAYNAIKDQPYDEWLILLNNRVRRSDLPVAIQADPRTRAVPAVTKSKRVGALKREACAACTGDILVELDHDDLLLAPGIVRVREMFTDPAVVFAYSRYAEFNNLDNSSREFDKIYGWQYEDFIYGGVRYRQPINPPADPYHASIVFFAPNHLRAWRKSAYDAAGGHNADMNVLDDSDLICRLYLQGEFAAIEDCCYLYLVHGGNTWLERNAEIQANVLNMRRRYLPDMVTAWARRNGRRMIDLGGRFSSPPGYESVDLKDADVTADLTRLYPFEDSSIAVVRAHDFMEHVADKMHTLAEIHRILMPGGYLLSLTPSTTGPNGEAGQGADQDPTHVSRWNRNAFWYVTRQEQAKYIDNTSIRFHPALLENCFPSEWHRQNCIPYTRADLVCLKDGYRPHGLIEI